ncbi:Riboflavin kinase protein [Rutstroemia sp. NJR-2017a BBW]|nr:Riboflavin kinase protein [Rutstroemia sp. NJR-2017a BBW]
MPTAEPRPMIVGPDSGPEPPFPLRMKGKVVSGFGRGSKELGIPTANIPVDTAPWIDSAASGVYFGYASLDPSPSPSTPSTTTSPSLPTIYPMVMSIGYNPFYKNTVRSAEVHLLHKFDTDFYGSFMRVLILGYIRPELDYVDLESLVKDIECDIEVARGSVEREAWRRYAEEGGEGWGWLVGKGEGEEEGKGE